MKVLSSTGHAMIFIGLRRFILATLGLCMMTSWAFGAPKIKEPNVSGQFYDHDPKSLSQGIDRFFDAANITPSEKAIAVAIAPHAGYMYSGGVAAHTYKVLSQRPYNTIVILAPSHYVGFEGVSIWNQGGFRTPLGTVDVDEEMAGKLLAANKNFVFLPEAFDQEHSLEVQIPFLQKTFKSFKIVPVIFGQPEFGLLNDFALALKNMIGDRQDVLVLVSTDLSHYHDAATAEKMDHRTLDAVKNLQIEELWKECHARTMEMCGCVPVTAALLYARQKGLKEVEVLKYAHSGHVTADMGRVVGYSSIVIYENRASKLADTLDKDATGSKAAASNNQLVSTLSLDQKNKLLKIARDAIEMYVKTGKALNVTQEDPRLFEQQGAFVTIHSHGQLRGCIGHIIGSQPLYLTVRDMAIAAAAEDPRFEPVKTSELANIEIEVSVLSKPKVITDVAEIQLGVHGVIVSQGFGHHGVFLPQVATETGWTKEEFLSQLCAQKAGLAFDAWKDPRTKIEIFSAEVFSETEH